MKPRAAGRLSPVCVSLLLFLALLAACGGSETAATEVLVVIESDLVVAPADGPNPGLTALRVRTFDPPGLRMLDERAIPLTPGASPEPGSASLPFSFSIVPTTPDSTSTFRLVVTGLGTNENGETVELVERQVLFTFRPKVLQEVRIFLAQGCVAQLCRGADGLSAQTCNPETGTCEELSVATAAHPGDIDAGTLRDGSVEGSEDAPVTTEADAGDPDAAADAAMPAETVDVAEACVGSSGATVCAEAHLIQCDEAGQVVSDEPCTSARHCQAGLPAGTCPTCLEGEHRCTEATLERCNAALEWETAETCASVDLCNAEAKACTDAACLAGSKICEGDVLKGCNAAQSGFELRETCPPGLCDDVAGECDICIPGLRTCQDGASVRSCSADGQTSNVIACDSSMPKCTGDGVCVQCTQTSDCVAPSEECRAATCDVAKGTCGSSSKPAHTRCSGGVCDGAGSCKGCVDASDCGGSTPECKSGKCVECSTDSHCGGSAGECMAPSCQTSNGTCGFTPKPARTRCSGGVCDGSGTCVGCVSSSDCSGGTPYCSGGGCVECTADSHCNTSAHEACKSNKCVVQPYCGDGQVSGGEECDPTAAAFDVFSCSETCYKRKLYNKCASQSDCAGGALCFSGHCTFECGESRACPAAPVNSGLTSQCRANPCILTGCVSNSDCPTNRCITSNGIRGCVGCTANADCSNGMRCVGTATSDIGVGYCQP